MVHSIKIYVPWFEKFLFESTKCDEFFKKEVRGRKVMECTLLTLLMPTPIWHKNVNMPDVSINAMTFHSVECVISRFT